MPKKTDAATTVRLHWFAWLVILIVACFGLAHSISTKARAQHHDGHAQFHPVYQDWVNKQDVGCCNKQDCRPIGEAHERIGADGEPEVYITGVGVAAAQSSWCKVLPHHYLSKGNAPNWATAHVCVTARFDGTTPCEQFICYQPRPQI